MSEQSPCDKIAALPEAERKAFAASLSPGEAEELLYEWEHFLARPSQLPPKGLWDIWLVLAGRGFGKTRTGAEWVRAKVQAGAKRLAIIGETQKDLEEVMCEGDSGLLSVFPPKLRPEYSRKPVSLKFHTGAIGLGYNATQPGQLRGPQFDAAWCDEIAKWRYARATWDQLQFGLRLGDHPQVMVTTTPRPIELVRALVGGSEGKTVVTRGRTLDNSNNLAGSFLERIQARYGDTRLGRQELDGEILGDLPGALWRLQDIDTARVPEPPGDLERIIVSVDHAVTAGEDSNEHGVVVAGIKGRDAYVLEDASLSGSPFMWARRAIALYDHWGANGIVIETNQGGDMVRQMLESVRQGVPIIEVRATRGKHVRAEPIAALYEQGRVHHCGSWPELEQQLTEFTTAGYEGPGSPDRADALVWALTELFPEMISLNPVQIPAFKRARGIV